MPQYKLTYFDIRGFGEAARLLFHHANVPFEDVRLKFPPGDDFAAIKPNTPFGELPMLEVDGKVISGVNTICRYLGKQLGVAPKDPIQEAIVDSVLEAQLEFALEVKPYFMILAGLKEGDKEKLFKELFEPAKEKFLNGLEKLLAKSTSGFLVGGEATYADIPVADHLEHGLLPLVPTLYDNHPGVKKFVGQVLALPNVDKWIAERPKTAF